MCFTDRKDYKKILERNCRKRQLLIKKFWNFMKPSQTSKNFIVSNSIINMDKTTTTFDEKALSRKCGGRNQKILV